MAVPTSNWWDSNYQYRLPITVSNNSSTDTLSAGYYHRVVVDVASLITASKVRTDGLDWRVLYWDGAAWNELDRVTKDWNTSTTRTYFKIAADIAASGSDDNYYIYYGYASETTSPPSTIDSGLVSWWPFDGGDAVDIIGSNNGTINGSTQATGFESDGYDFDGVNDYIDPGSYTFGTSFTVLFWMKPTLYNYGDPFGEIKKMTFVTYADGHMVYAPGDGSSWGNVVSTSAGELSNGVWYHVAGTYNGSQIELYIDGVSKGTASNTLSVPSTDFFIGSRNNAGVQYPFDGVIDEVRIYDYALTGTQIGVLYIDTAPSSATGTEETQSAPSGRISRYVDLAGLGGQGQMVFNPLT